MYLKKKQFVLQRWITPGSRYGISGAHCNGWASLIFMEWYI